MKNNTPRINLLEIKNHFNKHLKNQQEKKLNYKTL